MKNPEKLQARVVLLLMTIGLIALASFVIVLLNVRSKDQAAHEQLRATVRELRLQLDEKDRTLSDLRATVTATASRQAEGKGDVSLNAISELRLRIAEMGSVQTQTLALVQSMAAQTRASQSPERAAKERRAALAAFEEASTEHEVKLAAARKKAEELLVALRVPNDVSAIPSDRALSMPSAKAYWPYFEARREQEMLQLVAERLKLKIIQEQIDSRVLEKAGAP